MQNVRSFATEDEAIDFCDVMASEHDETWVVALVNHVGSDGTEGEEWIAEQIEDAEFEEDEDE